MTYEALHARGFDPSHILPKNHNLGCGAAQRLFCELLKNPPLESLLFRVNPSKNKIFITQNWLSQSKKVTWQWIRCHSKALDVLFQLSTTPFRTRRKLVATKYTPHLVVKGTLREWPTKRFCFNPAARGHPTKLYRCRDNPSCMVPGYFLKFIPNFVSKSSGLPANNRFNY